MASKKAASADRLEVEYSTTLASGWGEDKHAAEETSAEFGVSRTGAKTSLCSEVSGTIVKDT